MSQDYLKDYIAKFNPATKVWVGPIGKHLFPMDTYLGDLFLEAFDRNPEKIVQINHDEGTEWIAKDLKLASIRVAQNLAALGIKPDDVIGLNVINSVIVYPIFIGCILSGALMNPLHVSFTKESVKQMFRQTTPKVVICDADVCKVMVDALNELENEAKVFTVSEKIAGVAFIDDLLAPTGIEDIFRPIRFDKPAYRKGVTISCTSGTTGEPKGCLVTHEYFMTWSRGLITPKSPSAFRSFTFNLTYWMGGNLGLITPILNPQETRICTKQYFNIETLVEVVEKYKPSVLSIPPNFLTHFLDSPLSKSCDFSSVTIVNCYGSIVKENLRERFKLSFPNVFLSTIYGMTETLCAFTFHGDSFDGLTVGRIAANVYLRIVDEDGNVKGINEKGEIRIKPEFGFSGYFNNEKATQDAIDEEGFFKTGDLGYVDEKASIYVIDRFKEAFKYCGFHVSPLELETFISEIEGVQNVCVVGVPDSLMIDFLPAAVVIKNPNCENLTEELIANAVAAKFPVPKHLHGGVYFVDAIPSTPSGKFKKNIVKEIATELYARRKALT